jgi:GT2 family glycosyltransferase
MTTAPGVDIVIVSHETREDLLTCLASIFESSPRGLGRVFVVDNASTDGSPQAVAARWPSVDLTVLDRNLGFGAANNLALRRATAPLVLLLNSDTVVPPGAVDVLVDRLEARGATAAGPRLRDGAGRIELSFGAMLSPGAEGVQKVRGIVFRAEAGWARRYADRLTAEERWVDWVTGACLLVRREAALEAGLFDERFFLYEEDVDFCAALRARGGRILFTPAADVTHLRGRSSHGPSDGASHYDRSHVAFYEKHAPRWAPWLRRWLRLGGRAVR